MKNRQPWIQAVRVSAACLLTGVLGWYAYAHREQFRVLTSVPWRPLSGLAAAAVVQDVLAAAHFRSLCKPLGAHLSIWESLGLLKVATAWNMVLPAQAGTVARATYLKKRHGLAYSQVPAIMIGSMVTTLMVGGVILATIGVAGIACGDAPPGLLWVAATAAIASFLLLWLGLPPRWTTHLGRLGRLLDRHAAALRRIRAMKARLSITAVYQLLRYLAAGLVYASAYRCIGYPVSPATGVCIAVLSVFSTLVVVTPSNIGIREALVGYASVLSGLTFAQGIAASVLVRAVGMVLTLTVAPVAWYVLFFKRAVPAREVT